MDWLAKKEVPLQKENKQKSEVLIVDDEQSVHDATKLAMKKFEFSSKNIHFNSAFSAKEAKEFLLSDKKYALILLDVVMESENAGLELAAFIRKEINNSYTRIVLRTGQPGVAPEQNVIRDYDIDGYKSKNELKRNDLETTFYTSLRAYRDICRLQSHRKNLEYVIKAINKINEIGELVKFISAVMEQLKAILNINEARLILEDPEALAISHIDGSLNYISSTNSDVKIYKSNLLEDLPKLEKSLFERALKEKRNLRVGTHYIYYHHSDRGYDSIFAFESQEELGRNEVQLIDLFLGNVVLGFENLILSESVKKTQELAINLMGGAMESRSKETGAHVKRVGQYAKTLAELSGQSEEYCEKIALASQLHDCGKVGIPDYILNKNGKLDEEEWEIMKTHSYLGWEILSGTENSIIDMAAMIALEHHEKWDGSEYPNNKKGEDIILEGRISAIADVFDALCSKRCYKDAWPIAEARAEVNKCSGNMFDPTLVKLFDDNFHLFETIFIENPDQ